jgi:hypothetical protein
VSESERASEQAREGGKGRQRERERARERERERERETGRCCLREPSAVACLSLAQHPCVARAHRAPETGECMCSIRQHTSAYVSIRQHTSAYVSVSATLTLIALLRQVSVCAAYVSIRQHTSAYVSMRQHTSAYVSVSATLTLIALPRTQT